MDHSSIWVYSNTLGFTRARESEESLLGQAGAQPASKDYKYVTAQVRLALPLRV